MEGRLLESRLSQSRSGDIDKTSFIARVGNRPRIVILKPGGLGDFLSTTPALRALRKSLPRAHISLIVRPQIAAFCRRYPQVDDVVACPPYTGMTTPGDDDEDELKRFFSDFESRRLDLALQWAGNGVVSNRFAKRLGARFTVGFRVAGAEELDLSLPFDDQRHEVLRFLDCLAALGIPADGLALEAPLLEEDFVELRQVLPEHRDGRSRYLGINPTSDDPKRRWPADRFALVADRLIERHGYDRVIIIGGPGQSNQTQAVSSCMHYSERAIDLAGALGLGGLTALLSGLRLFITTDSGPAHLAAAVGTPSVIIFGAGPPVKWSPTSWLWQRPLADWSSPCRQFFPGCCEDLPVSRCLDKVTVEQVLAEADHLAYLANIIVPPNIATGTQLAQQRRDLVTRNKSGTPRG